MEYGGESKKAVMFCSQAGRIGGIGYRCKPGVGKVRVAIGADYYSKGASSSAVE